MPNDPLTSPPLPDGSQPPGRGRVLSAMSGGVDSSVATLLLHDEGYEVIGITMHLFDDSILPAGAGDAHGSRKAIEDARALCSDLGIEHRVLECTEPFATEVMGRFCRAFLGGTTPNPCIDCNRHLKIAALQRYRREAGADFIATGHYVRRRFDERTGTWQLLRAADPRKDQSYVLYRLAQDDLAHMLFPLGELSKEAARGLASERGLASADKQDSQDICFAPDGDHVAFIERYARLIRNEGGPQARPEAADWVTQALRDDEPPFAPGDIVDANGRVLGRHRGLVHYTIGQRKGIGVASESPLYVWDKDMAANRLVVVPREGLLVEEARFVDASAVSGAWPPGAFEAQVKCGYNQPPRDAIIKVPESGEATMRFVEPHVRPAPGQSAVVYDGDVVLGGGIIA